MMFWGNSILNYLIFVSIFFTGFLVVKIIEHVILRRLKKWAEKTTTTFDDFIIRVIKRIGVPLAYFSVFYLGLNILTLDSLFKKIINIVGMSILTLAAVFFGMALISYGFEVYLSKRKENGVLQSVSVMIPDIVDRKKISITTEPVELKSITGTTTLIPKLIIPSEIRFPGDKPPEVKITIEALLN